VTDIEMNWGSDLDVPLTIKNDDGSPMDLTGRTVDIIKAHPELADSITLTVTTAAAGRVNVRVEWADTMPAGRIMSFRIRVTLGSDNKTTKPFVLVVL